MNPQRFEMAQLTAVVYENLEEYIKVADLYQQLKNTEEENNYIEKAALTWLLLPFHELQDCKVSTY